MMTDIVDTECAAQGCSQPWDTRSLRFCSRRMFSKPHSINTTYAYGEIVDTCQIRVPCNRQRHNGERFCSQGTPHFDVARFLETS